jgi:pyrimidine-nucleoside phosphorylase
MGFVEAVAAKRDGEALDRNQIAEFVRGATDGSLPREQLAAMLMAVCCRGMNGDETRWLTDEMLRSGEAWDLAADRPEVVDKHSTGGVGDTVSLILAPLLSAVGVPVAMMAGRGLGHSQGTLDKLDAIPGWDSSRNRSQTLALVEECGAAIIAQTDDVAPADRTLYALRDVTGTVPSLPLIVASIMSKKLALGVATLILDVKWGSGAFRKTIDDARELAAALRQVAVDSGVRCQAVITDMNQPLGPALGTACEVREAVAVLGDGGDPLLREVTIDLSREAMVLRGWDAAEAGSALRAALADGSALDAWRRMVVAHGGDPDLDRLARPEASVEVAAAADGFVVACDGEELGRVAATVGAGRRRVEEELAHGAGVLVHARIGDRVERGQPVATLLVGAREIDQPQMIERIRNSFLIGPDAVEPPRLVLGAVDDV